MSVDKDTVRRIARLARLAVPEARLEPMAGELNGIFQWVEMLNEVDVEGVPAMTSGGCPEAEMAPGRGDRWRRRGGLDAERPGAGRYILRRSQGGGMSRVNAAAMVLSESLPA